MKNYQQTVKISRPLSVTLFGLGVLSIAVIYIFKFIYSIAQWKFLSSLPISSSTIYLSLSGLIWGVLWLISFYLLWSADRRSKKYLSRIILLFLSYFWIEQIFIMNNPLNNTNWDFLIISSLIFILLEKAMYNKSNVKKYFGELDE